MTIEQTVEMPASREIRMKAPAEVPPGPVHVILQSPVPEHSAERAPASEGSPPEHSAERAVASEGSPPEAKEPWQIELEEKIKDAERKAEARRKDPTILTRFYGCISKDTYGDALEYQRMMRDEWPD